MGSPMRATHRGPRRLKREAGRRGKSDPGIHPPGVEHTFGIEAALDPLGECPQRRRLRLERRRPRAAARWVRASASRARRARPGPRGSSPPPAPSCPWAPARSGRRPSRTAARWSLDAVQSTSSLAAVGGTEMRHSMRSGCSSATSRISRQSVAVSLSSRLANSTPGPASSVSQQLLAVGDRRRRSPRAGSPPSRARGGAAP